MILQGRRKGQMQPAKPRVLIYSRELTEHSEQHEADWNLIAAERVGGKLVIYFSNIYIK